MSSVSIATVQGQEIYDKISTLLVSREMPIESFLPYQSWDHEYKVDSSLREQLLSKLKDDYTIISDIVGILPSHKTTAYKLKTIIKQLFYHLPIRFQILIRNS
jgi:hypothetical protein